MIHRFLSKSPRLFSLCPALCAALALFSWATAATAEEKLSFNKDVRPILSDKCFACHGFDSKRRKAELRLDTQDGAYGKGKSGEIAIQPGQVDESELWRRISTEDKDEVMPPPKSHKPLTSQEKETLKRWIAQGATYQRHWAFEPPIQAAPPPVQPDWKAANPIDAFIFERLKKEHLAPAIRADKETLIRRVTLALTGLPPSIREVDGFLSDAAPDAYGKAVDRLMSAPTYGEQMARRWLDLARYADTHGMHFDNERSMWPYRDWVVGAFNRNLSFKQFTIEQLAGDLLPTPTPDQLVATGFERCNMTSNEGGSIKSELLFRYAVDKTTTMAETWMGLTVGCAVCHDHKFDPITQKEFYELYSFFNRSDDPAMDDNALLTGPILKLSSAEQAQRLATFDTQIKDAEAHIKAALANVVYIDPATVIPPIPAKEEETVLVEDAFPSGAKIQLNPQSATLNWTAKSEGPVSSGTLALRISGKELAQDYYSGGAAPIDVAACAKFTFMVFLDAVEPPKAVMIQLHSKGKWEHRAVWGAPEVIEFGTVNTESRYVAGALPQPGNWVQLEVDADKLGLKTGDQITGIAFTLFGGTAHFDRLTSVCRIDDANEPGKSLQAWLKPKEGKDTQGLPHEVNKIIKAVAIDKRTPADLSQLQEYYLTNIYTDTKSVFAPLQAMESKLKADREAYDNAIPATLIMREQSVPRESFVMERGAYDKPGIKVEPGVPAALPPLANTLKPNRLDLANWLVADEHPLTARVAVNRFWQQFFGVGLVKTPGDFGSQGQAPSHPELLDWLSVSFRESGWDVKKLVRLFVTSETFCQSSAASAELWARDPENRFHARGGRFRLDAEEVRDNILAVSGLLDLTMGGKGVRTYQPPNIWEPVGYIGSNTQFYKADSGSALYRRSLYTFLKRTAPAPFMANFDAPAREQTCAYRERSNTPMQALQLMNDTQNIEAARALAQRMMTEGGVTPEERIAYAYRLALARRPVVAEIEVIRAAFTQHLNSYQQTPEAAGRLIRQGESKPKSGLPEPELAAWTLVANLILNLDEMVTQ